MNATASLAEKMAPNDVPFSVTRTLSHYFALHPDPEISAQRVSFGTSGHRGQAHNRSFNEAHVVAITQAVVEYRLHHGIHGPLFVGKDTHALSEPAFDTVLSVLLANNIDVHIQQDFGFTPTPVISRLIIAHNANTDHDTQADGLIITPSHNPPEDGGIKYNPPHGGPAEGKITQAIEARANELLVQWTLIRRHPMDTAHLSTRLHRVDFIGAYVNALDTVIDMAAIADSGITIGADPMGGAGRDYWFAIAKQYGIDLQVVNRDIDPAFTFMPPDHDGKIRMDCSSPQAMKNLIARKDDFDLCVANDPDFDRHGIVTPTGGLMNPNHYLAVAIHYLFTHRHWEEISIGKTLVSSALIDRVAQQLNRPLCEVPVGFKWFVDGLSTGTCGFGGEESAGASFLDRNGDCWTTDKDGFILALLAAEILAKTGKDPYQYYLELTAQLGTPCYRRVDAPASLEQKQILSGLTAEQIHTTTLGGDPIQSILSHAPGNQAPIGGLKLVTDNGWVAARPSGTEALYKIYAESFLDEEHLSQLIEETQSLLRAIFSSLNNQ